MLIPSIDLQGGHVVQLVQGEKLAIEAPDPEPWITKFERFPRVQLIDLDAAKGQGDNAAIVASICARLPCRVGGGIRTVDRAEAVLGYGAHAVIVSSALFRGGVVDVDFARALADAIGAARDAVEWAREAEARGAGEILLTSMDRDGTRSGFDCEMTAAVSDAVNIPVIASGGAGGLEHFADVFTRGCADAALAASIFHFADTSVSELKKYLHKEGIPVRL